MKSDFEFSLNGAKVTVSGEDAHRPLLDFLRSKGKTGTKLGCGEGDCGACTMLMVETDSHGKRTLRSVNSCITPLPMVAGRELVSVEGVGGADGTLHPVQEAMVESFGSQCGYCTPGFTASMVEGFYRRLDTPAAIADQLSGNLCRCTGYRPIREALTAALARQADAKDERFGSLLAAPLSTAASLEYGDGENLFFRPTSLGELLQLRTKYPGAVLVAGATEIGVEINKKGRRFPILISTEAVEEIRAIIRMPLEWRIGGAAPLTNVEEQLGPEYPALAKMLTVFASRQIRNRATLAGNLVTASPIGDMAPVLLALDAAIELVSERGVRKLALSEFFVAYRQTALLPDEVVSAVIVPRPFMPNSVTRRTESYKVSKRRELDISIVSACFSTDIDTDGIVRRARVAYGGVAPTPSRALDVERLLEGRRWSQEAWDEALILLRNAFRPISDARGSAGYRSALVTSLFEKFCDGVESLAEDAPVHFKVGPVAQPCAKHESAVQHATGGAMYIDDQAQAAPMLEVWPVCSPHARARIVRRNIDVARAMPGVIAVLVADDIPGQNDVGAIRHDEVLLAADEVSFHGQLVALVVGESQAACRAAASKVEIEYEPLAPVLGLQEAIAQGSYHNEPHIIRRGDVDSALATAPHTLRGELAIGGQEHFYLETHAAWARCGDEGDVFVCSSTQHPSEVQAVVSHVLQLARNKVVVQSPRMGGGFGGKETQGNAWAALVALAAWRTRRPVRVQLDRDIDMMMTGKRHPFHADFACAFDDEGRVSAVRVDLVADGGWALDLSESICDRALFHLDNAYYLPNVVFKGRVAKTNTVSNTAFRGFGGPQGMVVIEEILDRIARTLRLPPELVRERNLYHGTGETNTTHYGQLIEDERTSKMWHSLKASARFLERRAEIERWNRANARVKRGIAITPVKFGISFTASFLNQAGALVLIYRDGSVQVNHGGTEMGQGLYTKVRGVTMRELGLPAESVRVMKTQTDKVPNTSATAASSGADLNCAAVKEACAVLRSRLAPVASRLLGGVDEDAVLFENGECRAGERSVPFGTVVEAAYIAQVSLSATGFYRTPNVYYDRTKGAGRPFHYFAGGVAITEVEVDGYTGMKHVLRADILHDVGDSLNPEIDRGQIEGGYVQGLGWLTSEELLWDEKGRLLTHSASTYQIPAISDAPDEFNVELLADAHQHNTIHGSKAVGEPPLMLAISAREAIRDAVAAFGVSGGTVALAVPATHEAIFAAVEARRQSRFC